MALSFSGQTDSVKEQAPGNFRWLYKVATLADPALEMIQSSGKRPDRNNAQFSDTSCNMMIMAPF